MKLPLRVEYACRVLAHLGRAHAAGALIHLDAMAEAEAVPANYLVQILNELRRGGLVRSRRGQQGGYALDRPPGEITLFDVVAAVDPDLLEFRPSPAGASGGRVGDAWRAVSEALATKLRSITIRDLLPPDEAGMYYI